MMKLTVAFLAALAAADAAEARSHRQARREYGYGSGDGYGSYDNTPVVSSAAVETPYESSAAYIQSSAAVFETSSSPADTVYPSATATPAAGTDYGNGYGATPPAGGESSSKVPSAAESSSVAYPIGGGEKPTPAESSVYVPIESSIVPAESSAYGSGFSESVPVASATPSGVYPSGGAGVPSGAYPSGGYGQPQSSPAVPKDATSSTPVGTVPYPLYPTGATGTGSLPASSTPLSDYVTKTIYSTQIFTKTAGTATSLSTSVVPVGTTVCPKESAYPEATPVKVSTSEYPVSEITNVVTETLVYTIGVGSSAHPVTTEVVSTSTSTLYSTVIVTVGKPTPVAGSATPVATSSAGGEGYPVASAENEQSGVSTIKSTTTSTKYITVHPTASANVPVGSESHPTGPAGGAGQECASPVTVTVTAKETVYVTKGSEQATGTPSSAYPAGETPSAETSVPAYPASSGAAIPSGKYPIGNGTNPYPAGPTGFKTSAKPAYPTGTGYQVPSKPSETSLPYFSFVSEAPSPSASSEVPAGETEVPYAPSSTVPAAAESSAAYPPAGGAYGSGYGQVPAASSAVATPYPSEVPSKTPSEEQSYPTPAGNGYGSGYGTY